MKSFSLSLVLALIVAPFVLAHDEAKDKTAGDGDKEVTGEVVDLMCYLDHAAAGDKHSGCAAKCIKNGGPVGLAAADKTYIVVGEHKAINDQLAEYAGKTVTMKGKIAERGGLTMLENAEIVKK